MTDAPTRPAAKARPKAKKPARGTPIEFFTPPNTLKVKLATDKPPVADPVKAAAAALENLSGEAATWMQDEFARIEACRRDYIKAPHDRDCCDALLASAIDMAGLAPVAGHPVAARFAASLTRLLGDAPEIAADNIDLVNAHVSAIRASRDRGADRKLADALAEELEARVTACFVS